MTSEEYRADADAAFALTMASDPAVRALAEVADKEVIRMAWTLGYVRGRVDGLKVAYGIILEARAA